MGVADPAKKRLLTLSMLGVLLIGSLFAGGLIVFADYYAVAPKGSAALKTLVAFFVLPFLLSVAIIPIALFCCVSSKRGIPPPTLIAIVPDYLPAIPESGMGAYPQYCYHVGKEELYDGNPWILQVFAPSGILNFDRFLYYPKPNYESWCGDPLEPVGDWAYLHE